MEQQFIYEQIPFQDVMFPLNLLTNMQIPPGTVRKLPLTWHEQLELLYFTRGGAVVECAGRCIHTKDNSLVLINPCEIHTVYYGEGSPLYDCIMIDTRLYASASQDICEMKYLAPMQNHQIYFENLVRDERAVGLVRDLLQEYRERKPAYEIAVKGDVLKLLSVLFRCEVAGTQSGQNSRQNIQRYERLEPALRHMEEHYSGSVHLPELAALCSMDPAHFCRTFKMVTSKTVMQYLNEHRLHKAEVLLKTTDRSIAEIALSVGFPDNCYFSRRFKQYFGHTPKEARQSILTAAPDKQND